MSTYTADIVKNLDVTTPTAGTWVVPEVDDAFREIKRVMAYEAGVTAVSSYPTTIAVTDSTLYCTGAGGTLNAPQLSTVSTTAYRKKITVINDSAAAITFDPYSTETVGGASTYSIPAGAIVEFLGHGGTDWEVVIPVSATPTANTIPVRDANGDLATTAQTYHKRLLRDQFLSGNSTHLGALGWFSNGTGQFSGDCDSEGESSVTITTGASAGNSAPLALLGDGGPFGLFRSDFRFTSIHRVTVVTATSVKAKIGMITKSAWNDGDKSDANGIFFFADTGTSANWRAITRSSSTETNTDTSVAISTSKIELKIVRRTTAQDGTEDVRFYINGSLVATHTTNIPAIALAIGHIIETSTTAARSLKTHYFCFEQDI